MIDAHTAPTTVADPLTTLALSRPSGLIGRVVSTPKETFAALTAHITPRQLEDVTTQCSNISSKVKSKILEHRVMLGAALYVSQQLHAGKNHGGFQRCLQLANIERRTGYRCLALFHLLGPHCAESTQLLAHLSIEAAQTLANKSTPSHIQQRFIQQAKAGHDVTYSAVKHAIDLEKPSVLPPADTDTCREACLDDVFCTGGNQIHYVFARHTSREQLIAAFQAALKEAVSKLPSSQGPPP